MMKIEEAIVTHVSYLGDQRFESHVFDAKDVARRVINAALEKSGRLFTNQSYLYYGIGRFPRLNTIRGKDAILQDENVISFWRMLEEAVARIEQLPICVLAGFFTANTTMRYIPVVATTKFHAPWIDIAGRKSTNGVSLTISCPPGKKFGTFNTFELVRSGPGTVQPVDRVGKNVIVWEATL